MKDSSKSKIPRLFEIMKSKGVTSAALARAVNVSQGNVTDWKMGRATPTAGVLITIAEYLDTTPDYLLGKTDKKEKPTADEGDEREELLKLLGKMFTNLSEEQKETVLRYAEFLEKNQ